MRLRSSVGVAFALAFLHYGSEAWADAGNGGNCPAATFVVTGIVSPQAAGTVSSVTVEVRTAAGARATGYTGTIRFTSTDTQVLLPANYTDNLNLAIARERAGCHYDALIALGMGMHAIMDSYSSSHEGFQTWSGWGDKSESAGHIVGDGLSGDSRTRTRDAALELRAYYSIFLT